MVKKNWMAIANIGSEQLRMSVISARGEIAEGLARGFPQYFLREGETHPLPNRADFIRLVSEMKRRDEVVQACKDAGIPFQQFNCKGTRRGSADGVSYAEGGYPTVAWGWGDYFWQCSKRRGETLEYEGAEWMVVWNVFSRGDACSFDRHTLIIVPVGALG
jgi:hypothetical protein